MSFNTKLINLLKTDPRFADDEGELVIAAVQDAAWKTDRALVKMLLPTPTFEKQLRLLAEVLDKNQLYVDLTEIDDARFQVSEEDKALNQKFYGERP